MIYCEKSNAWSEEDEYRLVSRNTLGAQEKSRLSLPSGDFVEFPELVVEAVYFGLRCDENSQKSVIGIFEDKLKAKREPSFFNVQQAADSYDLNSVPIENPMPFWSTTTPKSKASAV